MTPTLPEEAAFAAAKAITGPLRDPTEWELEQFKRALTAALPFLPVQGAVKKLEWGNARITEDGREAEDAESPVGRYIATDTGWFLLGRTGYEVERGLYQAKAAAQADYEARILSALEPSAARELAFYEGDDICARLEGLASWLDGSQHSKWCGRKEVPIHGYSGEGKLVRAAIAAIRALSSPDHSDAAPERAWYFKSGDTVPEWLEKIESGYCTLTFGVDVVVTSKDGGYEVRPQGIADNAGPILHVVNKGNVTPEIKGGGNGVAIIGYNRPYDETAGWRIARLKRLLEMARPYVECYDTREHNSEQDAVLTEIDKALSVVVGEPHADAGKVEGEGWQPIESAPKDGTRILAAGMQSGPSIEIVSYGRAGPYNRSTKKFAEGWYCIPGHLLAPSHWRPLPSAPASEGEE